MTDGKLIGALFLWVYLWSRQFSIVVSHGYWIIAGDGDFNDCQGATWHHTKRGDEVCMDVLGCFKLSDDYYHPQFRSCNVLPQPRSLINTRFILFTKNNLRQGKFLIADDVTSLNASGFDSNRTTKFIIHGIQENPLHDPWILIMMQEILENGDNNVVIVDWSKGSYYPYIQCTANARVVGAEIARLVKALEETVNLKASDMHYIGHGLGAHIAAYASHNSTTKPARITGLDPSYKYFCNMPENVRLNPDDADFVDIIHTELQGYDTGHGLCHALGHVDFFPNGGGHQPGCNNLWGSAISTHRLYSGYRGVSTCDHQRAVSLFITTIKPQTCRMIGYTCTSYKAFLRGECSDCGEDGKGCAIMGYTADEYTNLKSDNTTLMYLVTGRFPPFCFYEYRLRMELNASRIYNDYLPSGSLLVALKGQNKPLFVHLSFYSMHPGKEYTFLVTTPVDIGEVKNVSIKWEEYGTYEEGWQYGYGQDVFYFQSFTAEVTKFYVTLLNAIGSDDGNRSPPEVEFCKSNITSSDLRYPGWITFQPEC